MTSKQFKLLPLSSLCELINGYAFRPDDWSEYGVPIIRIQNLNGGKEFNHFKGAIAYRYLVEPGTLLFSWSGNRGTSFGPYRWDGPRGLLNQHIFKVIEKEGIDKRWLFYALHVAKEEAEHQAHGGSGLVHVRRGELLSYTIPTPTADEQRRIAEILDTIDKAIQKTEALIDKLKAMKQGLLHDLLIRGIDENGKLRDPRTHPEQFSNSTFGLIPNDWDTPIWDELPPDNAPICYGIVQPGPYTDAGVPVVAIKDLNGDYLNVHRSSKAIEKNYVRSRIHGGDVLLSVKGSTGRADIVPVWFSGNISRDVARIRLKDDVSPEYINQMLQSSFYLNYLNNAEVGTTRAEISIGILRRLCLPLPRLSEQKMIAEVAENQDNRIRAEELYLNKLKLQKEGLMHDLLTGKVRVRVPMEENRC